MIYPEPAACGWSASGRMRWSWRSSRTCVPGTQRVPGGARGHLSPHDRHGRPKWRPLRAPVADDLPGRRRARAGQCARRGGRGAALAGRGHAAMPEFSAERLAQLRDTLDYPPNGSPEQRRQPRGPDAGEPPSRKTPMRILVLAGILLALSAASARSLCTKRSSATIGRWARSSRRCSCSTSRGCATGFPCTSR